ncbi:hypothetical protein [Erwinia sp. OPT-41]|uniref:Uncharacterized protein n=1 Tax=Erwinia plantamica TaxID=3237104 RepID=A0ABW7CKY9_9GAMM
MTSQSSFSPIQEKATLFSFPDVSIALGTSRGTPFSPAYQGIVTLNNFLALIKWVCVNVAEYEEGMPNNEPVFLSRNHLALLREDIHNGRFALPGNDLQYGEMFYALQLLAIWAQYCICTLDFYQESAFIFVSWKL